MRLSPRLASTLSGCNHNQCRIHSWKRQLRSSSKRSNDGWPNESSDEPTGQASCSRQPLRNHNHSWELRRSRQVLARSKLVLVLVHSKQVLELELVHSMELVPLHSSLPLRSRQALVRSKPEQPYEP